MRAGVIITLVLVVFFSNVYTAQATDWWNSSWDKRRQITIINNANDALPSNYTVSFTIDTTGQEFLNNGNDLRIVYKNSIELDRINSTQFNSPSTTIHFMTVQSINAGGNNADYSVYYDNSGASLPPTNKRRIYNFSDDFDDGNYNGWIVEYGDFTVINGWLKGLNGDSRIYTGIIANFSSGIAVEYVYKESLAILTSDFIDLSNSWQSGYAAVVSDSIVYQNSFGKWIGSVFSKLINPNVTLLPNTSYKFNINSYNNNFSYFINSAYYGSAVDTTFLQSSRLYFFDSNSPGGMLDYVILRKYIQPEPTLSLGSQETFNGPTLQPIGNKFINENETLVIQLSATDPNNDTLVFGTNADSVLPSLFFFNETSGLFVWTSQPGEGGQYAVLFNVTDGNLTDSETILIKVNGPPVLSPIGDQSVQENETLIIKIDAIDPNDDTVIFGTDADGVLPSPFFFDTETGLFEWTPTLDDAGNYSVLFNVTDGVFTDEEIINITVLNTNLPPDLEFIGDRALNATQTLTIQLQATDFDNDTLTFSTDAGSVLPSSFFFNESDGLFVWTPELSDGGIYFVEFAVSDGDLIDNEIISIYVNGPPVLSLVGNKAVNEGQILVIQLNATDPNSDKVVFGTNAGEVLPSPFFFNKTTGLFVWSPRFTDSGAYDIKFNVTDSVFADEETITIFVIHVNLAPHISPVGNRTVNENETLIIQLEASDPDNDSLVFGTNATFGKLDNKTGLFNWTPTFFDAGLYTILFNVSDGALSDKLVVDITVINRLGPPVINPIPDITVNETDVVIIQPTAIDPDNDTITYSINDSRFAKFGQNIFIWDTQTGDAGNYTFLITASDGNLSDYEEVRVIVKKPYVCGDATGDTKVNLADIIYLVNYVFKGGPAPSPKESGDANNDGNVNLGDIVYLVNYVFKGGPKPCATATFSALTTGVTIGLGPALSNPDGTKTVRINENNTVAVAGNRLELTYDPLKVTILNVTNTSRTSGLNLIINDDKKGKLIIGLFSPDASKNIAQGTAAVVNLKVKGIDTGSLKINYAESVDTQARVMKTSVVNPAVVSKTTVVE